MITYASFSKLSKKDQYKGLERALTVFSVYDEFCNDVLSGLKIMGETASDAFFEQVYRILEERYASFLAMKHKQENDYIHSQHRDEEREKIDEAALDAQMTQAFSDSSS